jgi:hypothetical protein
VVVSGCDVGGLVRFDHSGHVEDLGFPVVLPTGNCPKQTLISDSESHLSQYLSINKSTLIIIFKLFTFAHHY